MSVRRSLLAAAAFLVAAAATVPVRAAPTDIEAALDRMSLREKVGQLVMFGISGRGLTRAEREVINQNHLGGVILFSRNYDDAAQLGRLTEQIQNAVRRGNSVAAGALISVDQEGGVVKRFPDFPPWYSAPEMGSAARESLAFDQGRATGRRLGDAGVNVNLAPVADLDLPPEHVMRSRSFGPRRFRAGRRVRAFSEGLQSKQVAATLKHFPGLGGATMNTDFGRSYVRRTRHQLRTIDAIPFQLAIDGSARVVMVSHAIYPNDGASRPASINHYIATKRLRSGFGFEGVAISDDLGAVAWAFDGSIARATSASDAWTPRFAACSSSRSGSASAASMDLSISG